MARSGRSRSSRDSRSSGQPRSWSASVRCPLPVRGRALRTSIWPSSHASEPAHGRSRRPVSRVELHYGAATDVGRCARSTRTPTWPPRRSSWSPTGWAATRAATSPAGSWSRSSPGWPRRATTRAAAPRPSRDTLTACQRPDHRVRRRAARPRPAATSRPARPRWSPCSSRTTRRPQWLLANLGDSRIYRFVDGELDQVSVDHSLVQELVDAGAITARGGGRPPRAARGHPRARRSRPRRRRLLPAPAAAEAERLLLCSDGVTGMIDDDAIAAIAGRGRRPARRRRPAGRRGRPAPVVATTPRPWWSMWWDWSATVPTTPSGSA